MGACKSPSQGGSGLRPCLTANHRKHPSVSTPCWVALAPPIAPLEPVPCLVISAGLTQTLSRRQDRCYDPHFPDGETLLEPLHDSLRATQGVQVSGLRPQPRAMMTPASLCCPPGLWGFKSCCCLVAQSCPTLCKPIDCSPPGSSVHGVLQARTLEWVAIFSSRGSSRPRDGIRVDCMGRRVLYHTTTWKAQGFT